MALADIVNKLIEGGEILKATRLTRVVLAYPDTLQTPYNTHKGVPTIASETPIRNAVSFSISENDTLAAAQITLTCANNDRGVYSDMLDHNDLLRVEEKWSNSDGTTTGWFVQGHFLIDQISPTASSGGASNIQVVGRDAFKWLTLPGMEDRLGADIIRISKKTFACKVDPNQQNPVGSFYVFVDGSFNTTLQRWIHTFDWADTPVPRVFDPRNDKRISYKDGSIQILYGTGEIIIAKDFFEAAASVGGLGNPKQGGKPVISVQYARYVQPEEEISALAITAISSDGKTLTMAATGTVNGASASFQASTDMINRTVVVTNGPGKNERYRVLSVNTSSRQLVVDRSVTAEGVVVGNQTRVGESNRVENVVERIALAAGFQNIDPNEPFYIAEIEQTNPQLKVPSTDEFDFRRTRRSTFLAAYEAVRAILPSNFQLYVDENTNLYHKSVTQKITADYEVTDSPTDAGLESSDADVYTRVVYYVRDRDPKNIASINNKPATVANFTWFNPLMNGRSEVVGALLHLVPENFMANLPFPRDRIKNAILDNRPGTGFQLRKGDAVQGALPWLDGLILFQIELDDVYQIREVNVTTVPFFQGVDTSQAQLWEIEYSEDGFFWELLGDEFSFTNGRASLNESFFGTDVRAKYFRFRLVRAAAFNETSEFLIITNVKHRLYAAIADVVIYQNDIIEAEAELGVDRFDYLAAATGTGTVGGRYYIAITDTPVDEWVGLEILALGHQWTIHSIDETNKRLILETATGTTNPATAGVVAGKGIIILEGQTDADFAADVERRGRLGRRTFNMPQVDEVGYFIVEDLKRNFDYTLARYAKDKAKEQLSERSRLFLPLQVGTIRPDARLRQTLELDLSRLGFSGNALVRELTKDSDGKVSLRATPFRDSQFGTITLAPSVSETVSTLTTVPEDGNDTTTTTTSSSSTTTTTTTAATTTTSLTTTITQPGGPGGWS